MFRYGWAVSLALTLGACAGREAVPIAAYQPMDEQLNCEQIDGEVGRNNAAIRSRVIEAHDRTGRNAMFGAVGILLFWPALFAIDLKDAAGTELRALDDRNEMLVRYANQRDCRIQTVLNSEDAKKQYVASFDEDGEPQAPQWKQPPAGRPTAVAANPPALPVNTAATVANPTNRDQLRRLMDSFLRGDIDQAEYKRQRAALLGG